MASDAALHCTALNISWLSNTALSTRKIARYCTQPGLKDGEGRVREGGCERVGAERDGGAREGEVESGPLVKWAGGQRGQGPWQGA